VVTAPVLEELFPLSHSGQTRLHGGNTSDSLIVFGRIQQNLLRNGSFVDFKELGMVGRVEVKTERGHT
jgi:hypothetical protein